MRPGTERKIRAGTVLGFLPASVNSLSQRALRLYTLTLSVGMRLTRPTRASLRFAGTATGFIRATFARRFCITYIPAPTSRFFAPATRALPSLAIVCGLLIRGFLAYVDRGKSNSTTNDIDCLLVQLFPFTQRQSAR